MTVEPAWIVPPSAGEVIVEAGALTSIDASAGTRSPCSVEGWARMSANTLTVACCIAGTAAAAAAVVAGVQAPRPLQGAGPEDEGPALSVAVHRHGVPGCAAGDEHRPVRRRVDLLDAGHGGVRDSRIVPYGLAPLSRSSSHS